MRKTGRAIDLLRISTNFFDGRIFPSKLEGVDHALKILKPKACLALEGSESTEFVL